MRRDPIRTVLVRLAICAVSECGSMWPTSAVRQQFATADARRPHHRTRRLTWSRTAILSASLRTSGDGRRIRKIACWPCVCVSAGRARVCVIGSDRTSAHTLSLNHSHHPPAHIVATVVVGGRLATREYWRKGSRIQRRRRIASVCRLRRWSLSRWR